MSDDRIWHLSDFFDGDLRARDGEARRVAASVVIPHPLHEVRYADGVLRDTTAGRIHTRNVWWTER